jgi:sarcosine oxidase, subunit alpha
VSGSLRLGRRRIPIEEGDTVAAALYRAGVLTLSRSVKHHRRRGLACGTGDCPSCLLTIDGVPGVRSCVTPARDGMRVRREGGWPTTEHDLLAVLDRFHVLLPVGFYHKTFVRPRWAWPLAERLIRRATGLGRLPSGTPAPGRSRNLRCDVLVVGAGPAGRTAAGEAAAVGAHVVLCDEGEVPEPPDGVEVLERHAALGVYAGPLVPLATEGELVRVHPRRVVVATGAVGAHAAFRGNDLPGVLHGRAAAALAARGVRVGERAVVVAGDDEGLEHLAALHAAGVRIVAAVVPDALADRVPESVRTLPGATIVRADGRKRVRTAVVRDAGGVVRGFGCDALVLSLGRVARDDLARTSAAGEPVELTGDVARTASPTAETGEGYVCLCEDVTAHDLQRAWNEGFRSTELLKRYTTVTMGPCHGALCGRHLAGFAAARGAAANAAARTTARPPVRPAPLEILAAGVDELVERRTALHDLHLAAGARMGRSGAWTRPHDYGEPEAEYRAVREAVSIMDVGTLGKLLVSGPDATELIDATFPTRTDDLGPGRARYLLSLDEAGYVVDDGLLCGLGDEGWYLTTTSGGADRFEARLRDRADRLSLRAHVVDLTSERGAIVVAGPRARDLLGRLTDDPVGREAFPHLGVRELTVAGVACGAIRTGFVGEVAFELHHPWRRGPDLWRALVEAGEDLELRPHGLDALEVLRLEKGHLYVGQDTLPDDTPAKLGLSWSVDLRKDRFVGRRALDRLAVHAPSRKLVGLRFDRGGAELRGTPLSDGARIAGRVTSAAWSPTLEATIGLGWILAGPDGTFPEELRAGRVTARVSPTPFYDPDGDRLDG